MAKLVRTFIAVEMPAGIRNQAVRLQRQLGSSGASVKWVEEENIHLTLKFLGEVDQVQVPAVCAAVREAAAPVPAFGIEVRGVGAFPTMGRPRTLWIGIAEGAELLAGLYERVEQALSRLGFAPEGRRFTAHVTIGRVRDGRHNCELAEALDRKVDWSAGDAAVDELLVMASELTPAGPQYTVMGRAALGG